VSTGTKDLVIGVLEQPCTHISSLGVCVSALYASPTDMDDNIGCLQLLLAIVEVLLLALVATFGALDSSAIQDLLDPLDESNCFPVKGHSAASKRSSQLGSKRRNHPIDLFHCTSRVNINFNLTRPPWGKDAVPV